MREGICSQGNHFRAITSARLAIARAKIARFACPIWAPPGGKVAVTYPDHQTKYHPNRPPKRAEKKHLLHSSRAPWWTIWAPPGGKVTMTYPDHPTMYQPNRAKNSWKEAPFTMANQGATWWQVRYDLPDRATWCVCGRN